MKLQERTVDGMKLLVSPIDALAALDLANELVAHVAPGAAAAMAGRGTQSIEAGLDAFGMISAALIGRLSSLLPRLLAGTVVTAGGEKYDLTQGANEVNRLFGDRPLALRAVVAFSAEVQLLRFFPASALVALKEKTASLSAVFSQSTSATGSSTA